MRYAQLYAGIPELLVSNPFYSLYPAAYGLITVYVYILTCIYSVVMIHSVAQLAIVGEYLTQKTANIGRNRGRKTTEFHQKPAKVTLNLKKNQGSHRGI